MDEAMKALKAQARESIAALEARGPVGMLNPSYADGMLNPSYAAAHIIRTYGRYTADPANVTIDRVKRWAMGQDYGKDEPEHGLDKEPCGHSEPAIVSRHDTEISLGWARKNPTLFTKYVLEFWSGYSDNEWHHTIDLERAGFVRLIAVRRGRTL